jgi:hypothetical protein
MTEGTYVCRKCGKPIYWHKSLRTGNSYPCDSPTDRRAFHKCDECASEAPFQHVLSKCSTCAQQPNLEKPVTPDRFEPTIEERVSALENLVSRLSSAVNQISGHQPITDKDIPF